MSTGQARTAPGTYHTPKTVASLVALVDRAYCMGRHIRPVGSALSPNGLAFDCYDMDHAAQHRTSDLRVVTDP